MATSFLLAKKCLLRARQSSLVEASPPHHTTIDGKHPDIEQSRTYQPSRRKHRRIATAWLNVRAVNAYTDILDKEATVLLQALYDESQGGMVPVNPQVR